MANDNLVALVPTFTFFCVCPPFLNQTQPATATRILSKKLGMTAMHIAASAGFLEIMRILAAGGEDNAAAAVSVNIISKARQRIFDQKLSQVSLFAWQGTGTQTLTRVIRHRPCTVHRRIPIFLAEAGGRTVGPRESLRDLGALDLNHATNASRADKTGASSGRGMGLDRFCDELCPLCRYKHAYSTN